MLAIRRAPIPAPPPRPRYPGQLFGLADAEQATVVFADIGGNRASAALTPLLLAFGALRTPPVLTVIKCAELYATAAEHAAAHGGSGVDGAVPDAASLWSALKEQHGQADPGPAAAAPPPATQPDDSTGPSSADSSPNPATPPCPSSIGVPPSAAGGGGPPRAGDGRQLNPNCAPDETRICFQHLNSGRCNRAGCGYRHLPPDHPDAQADLAKRSKVGWRPEDPRRRPGATVPKA